MIQLGMVGTLPPDQWKRESTYCRLKYEIALADCVLAKLVLYTEALFYTAIQVMLSDHAIGFLLRDPRADEYTTKPTTAAERTLCKSMRMRKSGGFG